MKAASEWLISREQAYLVVYSGLKFETLYYFYIAIWLIYDS